MWGASGVFFPTLRGICGHPLMIYQFRGRPREGSMKFGLCNRGDRGVSRRAPNKEAMPIPYARHCCNSGIFCGASPRCFPYTITRLLLKSQHVMRDTALELGPPSGTGKLIPLLLDAGTSRCTRLPPPTDGIFQHLTHGHTSFTAQV